MNVRKFIAVNAREALRKVKETLGPDAIILSNRGVPGGVEIMAVAARDMAMIVPAADEPVRQNPPRTAAYPEEDGYRVSLSTSAAASHRKAEVAPPPQQPIRPAPAPARPVSRPAPASAPVNASIPRPGSLRQAGLDAPRAPQAAGPVPTVNARPTPAHHAGAEVVPAAVMEEIRALRKIVEQHLAGFAWGESARNEPVKTEVLRQMLDAGFSPQLARELLAELPPEMDAVQAVAWVRGVADRSLLTLHAEQDIIDKGGFMP